MIPLADKLTRKELLANPNLPKLDARFNASIQSSGTCWLWTGYRHGVSKRNNLSYGAFYAYKKKWQAHRWAYLRWVGELYEGFIVDHLCTNSLCVNPQHLEQVTQGINLSRSVVPKRLQRRKLYCPNGHPYDSGGIRLWGGVQSQGCQECKDKNKEVTNDSRAKF